MEGWGERSETNQPTRHPVEIPKISNQTKQGENPKYIVEAEGEAKVENKKRSCKCVRS